MFTNQATVPFCVDAFTSLSQYKYLIIYYMKAYLSPVMCIKKKKERSVEQRE